MKYTNQTGIPLSLAVWLTVDKYDHNTDPKTISATSLLKPMRSLVLESTIPVEPANDVANMIASRMGTAIHESIEYAWLNHSKAALERLGYPDRVIKNIAINPDAEFLERNPDAIPVYMEIRSSKVVHGYTITGKFDFVAEGRLEDFKSTSAYTWITGTNDEKFMLQGSIYKWLNPSLITNPVMGIDYLFTDWSAAKAKQDKSYPQQRILNKNLTLLTVPQTQSFVEDKVLQFIKLKDLPQAQLPECTSEELWERESVWKYYRNPAKTTRSTKNFDNPIDAHAFANAEGKGGIVKEVKGEIVYCKYCNAVSVCTQKDQYILDGRLKM